MPHCGSNGWESVFLVQNKIFRTKDADKSQGKLIVCIFITWQVLENFLFLNPAPIARSLKFTAEIVPDLVFQGSNLWIFPLTNGICSTLLNTEPGPGCGSVFWDLRT